MINVKSKICTHEGCGTQSGFGFEGEKEEFCSVHKLKGMINLASGRCNHEGCIIIPGYGFPGNKPIHCSEHKQKEK